MNTDALRILVVDDHGVVRRGVRALLESHPGWQVVGEGAMGATRWSSFVPCGRTLWCST